MPSVTIKKFPGTLLGEIKRRAVRERRSLTKQVIHLLEQSLTPEKPDEFFEAKRQVAAWEKLAGRWESKIPAKQEIANIYRSRSKGRNFSL